MGEQPDSETCKRVIERCAQVGFSVITLGGGDPMLYAFLPALIESAKKSGMFVHVDTNGIGLQCTRSTALLLKYGIDLLALPLDGPRAEVHNPMRSAKSHFQLVLNRLAWLAPFMHKVKINTFVSILNANEIPEMAALIENIAPSRWSLYQYWPLSLGKQAVTQHFISNEQFSTTVAKLPTFNSRIHVELNPMPLRRLTYPFVSHDGIVYLHHQADQSKYEFLGPIFDDAVIDELFTKCAGEREIARSRYDLP